MLNAQIKHHIELALPLFQMMAALGAPDTWQVNVATAPSVTVISTGAAVKSGAIPAEHTHIFNQDEKTPHSVQKPHINA